MPIASLQEININTHWALTLLCLIVWGLLIRRHRLGASWMPCREMPEAPWGLIDVWVIMAIWFLGQSAAPLLEPASPSATGGLGWVRGGVTLLTTAAGAWILWWRYGQRFLRRLLPREFQRELLWGIVAFVAIVPPIFWLMMLLVLIAPYRHDTLEQIKLNPTPIVLAASFFSAAVVAPICEEFFFRLILQPWLGRIRIPDVPDHRSAVIYGDSREDTLGPTARGPGSTEPEPAWQFWWPIAATAATFAALHLGQGPAPIALFALALALGYLYRRTGSFLACIVVHVLLNAFSLTWQSLDALEKASRAVGG
jgi:membrane protease YdiL (CAAX protease family)